MSKLRVYLFADFGKGPRNMGVAHLSGFDSHGHARTSIKGTAYYISPVRALKATGNRAWWLVECESAEAGRHAIMLATSDRSQPPPGHHVHSDSDGVWYVIVDYPNGKVRDALVADGLGSQEEAIAKAWERETVNATGRILDSGGAR